MGSLDKESYDILIIGAGLSGLSSLYNIRKRFPSWKVRVLEAGPSVGGTWYWNCYPGARFDSESISYQLTCDKELLQEWNWKESFAPQAETLRYIERFADKNNLRSDIQFNTTIASARWQDGQRSWLFTDSNGAEYTGRFFISCVGILSNPSTPNIPGIDNFKGQAFHTSRFPKDLVVSRDLAGKRVGVIGTGATGIQTITSIAKEPIIESLSVFQRNATWAAPLRNTEISEEQMKKYKDGYEAMFRYLAETPSGFLHKADPRKSSEVTHKERVALWEKLYEQPGFGKWLGNFSDTYTDREANRLYSDWMANKIRARVNDPLIAEKLVPKNHGFGTRRVPLESGYYDSFNNPKVHLVDIMENPIASVTEKGIVTTDGKAHDLDVLIFATGFDAITGSFSRIDWQSKSGRPLVGSSATEKGKKAIWVDHRPTTAFGILAPDMPNMFMVLGPHQPFGNVPRSIENAVEVVMGMLEHCHKNGFTYVEPTQRACDEWTEHVFECGKGALANEIDSWLTGVNTNVEGKSVRTVARYGGSVVEYRRRCEESKTFGFPGLIFD
ncbi:hypothetical protein G7Z17_g2118 [Cylindrodendrum hubeiense]|uniref:Cyclohexanone monooxygenase n=1 Tax=Cylindrodendrum hubeiense TaxID=595255 RepID=A0A9P5HDG5_9HYPO|nr:hypothetical protein G7Z17_g2118 [Cylindrodendrum hubeiense]